MVSTRGFSILLLVIHDGTPDMMKEKGRQRHTCVTGGTVPNRSVWVSGRPSDVYVYPDTKGGPRGSTPRCNGEGSGGDYNEEDRGLGKVNLLSTTETGSRCTSISSA